MNVIVPSSYIRWFISAHLLIGNKVDTPSRESINKALQNAQIRRMKIIDIPTLRKILLGQQLLVMNDPIRLVQSVINVETETMPALSPVLLSRSEPSGSGDWCFSLTKMPTLGFGENDMNIESLLDFEENDMDTESQLYSSDYPTHLASILHLTLTSLQCTDFISTPSTPETEAERL